MNWEINYFSSNTKKFKSDALKTYMTLIDSEDTSIYIYTYISILYDIQGLFNSHMGKDSNNSSSQGPKHSENISGGVISALSVI